MMDAMDVSSSEQEPSSPIPPEDAPSWVRQLAAALENPTSVLFLTRG